MAETNSRAHAEVRRRFEAAPAQVFAAFADRDRVARWLRPAPEVGLSVLQFDFRVGGAYRFAYEVPNGPAMVVLGTYRLIEPPTRLVFSWLIEPPDPHAGIDSLVTVTLAPDGTGTELLIRHEKLGLADAIQRHAEGWRGAVDRLETLLAEGG